MKTEESHDGLAKMASAVGGYVVGKAVRLVWPGKTSRKNGGISIATAPNRFGLRREIVLSGCVIGRRL